LNDFVPVTLVAFHKKNSGKKVRLNLLTTPYPGRVDLKLFSKIE